jgi:hypothetical protein
MLLPKTVVSPSASDCARLSIDGFTVVRTLPVVPNAEGFLSRPAKYRPKRE